MEPVEAELRVEPHGVVLDIIDRGPGMAPEFVRDELFRPLRSTKSGGHGIGAYQARELLRDAGGDLLVISQPGAGTTMRVILPWCGPSVAGAGCRRGLSGMRNGQAQAADRRGRRGPVLPVSLGVPRPATVLMAHARPQAVALVKRERPPVAIMDLGLPPDPDGVSEGFATLEEVLRIAPQTKVIVVTGNGERKTALRAIASGAYDFCEKPVEIEVLRTIIERGLNLHRLEEENRRLAAAPARLADRADHHRRCGDAEGLPRHRKDRHDQRPRAAAGRKRHRQGGAGQGGARPRAARETSVRRHQLRRDPGKPAGKRAVRPRARRLHRRGEADHRQDRERPQGHAVPRRNRRPAASAAGQAAALPAGSDRRAHRRAAEDPGRCPHRLRHQRQPR